MLTTRRVEVLKLCAPALLLAAVLLLPFLQKAYAVDDPYFLLQAQQVQRQFTRPLNFTICWFQPVVCAPANTLAPGAALMGYALLPVSHFLATEAAGHVLQLLFLFGGVIATVSLALRWGMSRDSARFAGLFLVTFPVVVAITNTVMPDVLAMSLGVIALERLQAWLESRKVTTAVTALVAFGLAPYARVHAIGFLVVGGLMLVWTRNRSRASLMQGAMILIGGAGLFGGLTLLTGESKLGGALPPAFNLGLGHVDANLMALFFYYLVCFPVTAIWLVRVRRKLGWLVLAVCMVFALLLIFHLPAKHAGIWAVASVSLFCVGNLLWVGYRKFSYDAVLGAWLLMPISTTPYFHLPAKALMICAPAAALAAVTLLQQESEAFRRRVQVAAIAIFAVASLAILQADQRFAAMSKTATAELVTPYVKKGEKVWFSGTWGLYWYATRAGATIMVPGRQEPAPGDLVLMEVMSWYAAREPQVALPREVIARKIFAWDGGRVMDMRARAGLYSNSIGLLPWSYGKGEVARYELWRVGSPRP